jgi:hypothetical protein
MFCFLYIVFCRSLFVLCFCDCNISSRNKTMCVLFFFHSSSFFCVCFSWAQYELYHCVNKYNTDTCFVLTENHVDSIVPDNSSKRPQLHYRLSLTNLILYSINEKNNIYKCILFQSFEWILVGIQILVCHYHFSIHHECITSNCRWADFILLSIDCVRWSDWIVDSSEYLNQIRNKKDTKRKAKNTTLSEQLKHLIVLQNHYP